jgi:hypothetical protein
VKVWDRRLDRRRILVAWGAVLTALSGLAACDTDRDEQQEHGLAVPGWQLAQRTGAGDGPS